MVQGSDFTHVPGVLPGTQNPYPGVLLVRCKNTSGGTITAGDVMVHDPTAVENVPGQLIPMTTTTSADDRAGAGVVAVGESTIPDDGEFWLQVAGLHPSVNIDGTADLVNGDFVSSHTTAKAAAKAAAGNYQALGRYVDAAYTSNSVAAKKVVLLNPLGLRRAY